MLNGGLTTIDNTAKYYYWMLITIEDTRTTTGMNFYLHVG